MAILTASAVRSPMATPYVWRTCAWIDASKSNPPQRKASSATTPPSEITAISAVPPPTSTTMLPTGSEMARPAPMAAAIGCSIKKLADAPARRAASLTARPLDGGDGRGHADEHLGPVEPAHSDPAEQDRQHALGHLEVGDRPSAQRALGHDVTGRPPDHLPGVGPDGQHLAAPGVEGHHRGLVEHEALSLGVHERVGRAEVDGQVAGHGAHGTAHPVSDGTLALALGSLAHQ